MEGQLLSLRRSGVKSFGKLSQPAVIPSYADYPYPPETDCGEELLAGSTLPA